MEERRKGGERREGVDAGIDDIREMMKGLVAMLTLHMTNEELEIQDLKKKIDGYFHELDAHTHIFHHNKVAEDIEVSKETHDRWEKIKTGVWEKLIIFVFGALMSYFGALLWMDFANKVNAQQPTQTVTIQMPPAKQQPNPLNPPTVSARPQDVPPLP